MTVITTRRCLGRKHDRELYGICLHMLGLVHAGRDELDADVAGDAGDPVGLAVCLASHANDVFPGLDPARGDCESFRVEAGVHCPADSTFEHAGHGLEGAAGAVAQLGGRGHGVGPENAPKCVPCLGRAHPNLALVHRDAGKCPHDASTWRKPVEWE